MIIYRVSIGLCDAKARRQIVDDVDALQTIQDDIFVNFDGATITEGCGIYTHKDGYIVTEKTMIVDIFGDPDLREFVKDFARRMKIAFHQEAIYITEITAESIEI